MEVVDYIDPIDRSIYETEYQQNGHSTINPVGSGHTDHPDFPVRLNLLYIRLKANRWGWRSHFVHSGYTHVADETVSVRMPTFFIVSKIDK